MSREPTRRLITIVLLALFAAVVLGRNDGKAAALKLAPIAALLAPVVRWYFPKGRGVRLGLAETDGDRAHGGATSGRDALRPRSRRLRGSEGADRGRRTRS